MRKKIYKTSVRRWLAEKPKPNVPVNITKNAGVKESASKPKTYADIDVASFFNQ